jgi:hypothetical protein
MIIYYRGDDKHPESGGFSLFPSPRSARVAFSVVPMSARRSAPAAALAFGAFAILFGTASHLAAELFGLGWPADASVLASPRHAYLAVAALLALLALALSVRCSPGTDRRGRISALVDALPYRGRGMGFAALAFVSQFAFAAVTQIGEGYPLAAGDAVTGVIAGVVAAALGAVIVTLCKRRVLAFALALVCATLDAVFARGVVDGVAADHGPGVTATRRTPFAFRYRPPPIAA